MTVSFHDLSFVPEGDDEVVVGRLDTGSYAVLPADGAALLRRLTEGHSPDDAADWYEAEFGEGVDVEDFLDGMRELGFIRADDEVVTAAPVRFRRLGQAVFSPWAWLLYAAVVVTWLVVGSDHDDVVPDPGQFFFTGSTLVVQLVITFGQLPLVFLHEGFHTLAGRRLGLPSRLGVGNRYMYIVFETRMNGLLSVPAARRYLPFLSGMMIDVVALACLGLLAHVTRGPDGALSWFGGVCVALGFTVVMRLVWQFQFYLRTDLYYVFSTALRCHDLHEASVALLRNRWWRLVGRPDRVVDEGRWTDHDRRAGRWYGPFLVLGVGVMLGLAVFGSLPVVLRYGEIVVGHLSGGRFDLYFWDALVSLVINIGQLLLVAHLSRRKRKGIRS
ncbi:MAG: PqqD family protein [Saccharothrix sp.]|nr:PqqD family protein [Saccharothrix sp.]